jgi:hypothetical protein
MADIKKLLESIDRIDEKQSVPKQVNPVAKNAMATVGGGGYGKHKDKKKDQQVGKEKHKGSFMKDLAETAVETKELRKVKESWKQFQTEATAYDKRGITVSPNRKDFGDTADWQSNPYLDRDSRLASRASQTGSSTKLPSTDKLGKKLDPRGLKQTIKSRTGKDAYGRSDYAAKPMLPETEVASRKGGDINSIDIPNGTTVRVPHNGKMVTGKIVRFDPGHKSGTPFYVVDIGEYGSERVSVHNVKIAESQDYRYHKKGLENETFYKNVLDIMNDSSSESAEEAMIKVYGMMRKNDDPEAWESQVNTIVKLYNKVNDIGLGDSPAENLEEYGPQTTDPNAQSTNPDNQGGVTAPQQNKNTQQYKSVQQNSPSTVGTNVDTMDDPDTFINFMKDPKFANTLKTNKSFADQLKKAFSDAGYK